MERGLVLALCFLSFFWSLEATAERWQAPSRAIGGKGHQVAVFQMVEVDSEQGVLFRRVEDLIGESSKQIVLRIPHELVEQLTTGQSYLVGFSKYRKNPLFRKGFEIDSEGPRVVDLPGVGPAVFENVPELRRLIEGALAVPTVKAKDRLQDVMILMKRDDPGLLRFAAVELVVDPELLQHADKSTATGLRKALERQQIDLETRDFLFKAAVRLPDSLRREWVVAEDRRLLREFGPELDLATLGPSLVITALKDLERDGKKGDSELVSPFLGSNHPGVVRAAIRSLDSLDPVAAKEVAREMAKKTDLHPSSRSALENYLDSREEGKTDA